MGRGEVSRTTNFANHDFRAVGSYSDTDRINTVFVTGKELVIRATQKSGERFETRVSPDLETNSSKAL